MTGSILPTPTKGCGRIETMGHGDGATCGERYYSQVWFCDGCRLKAAEDRIRQLTDWQPMETAPKDGSWVVVHGLACDGRGGYWDAYGMARYDVTRPGGGWETRNVAYPNHWQPFVSPPTKELK